VKRHWQNEKTGRTHASGFSGTKKQIRVQSNLQENAETCSREFPDIPHSFLFFAAFGINHGRIIRILFSTDENQGEMRNTIIVLHACCNEVYYA